jgi:hypothetical protein
MHFDVCIVDISKMPFQKLANRWSTRPAFMNRGANGTYDKGHDRPGDSSCEFAHREKPLPGLARM